LVAVPVVALPVWLSVVTRWPVVVVVAQERCCFSPIFRKLPAIIESMLDVQDLVELASECLAGTAF
jgi:hypothetical protein